MPLFTPTTHDTDQASQLYGDLQQPGDLVLTDRGFCSYTHLALLMQAVA